MTERINIIELDNSIEMIYKETSAFRLGHKQSEYRVFKIVYSCIDGKWNKSERIYGEIEQATEETYNFD